MQFALSDTHVCKEKSQPLPGSNQNQLEVMLNKPFVVDQSNNGLEWESVPIEAEVLFCSKIYLFSPYNYTLYF